MIYADFNATTPLSKGAIRRMALGESHWGNPSSAHGIGRKANEIIEESRLALARWLDIKPLEVVFTSGGSEANTSALLGSYFQEPNGFRLLTSTVEHSSIRDLLPLLRRLGADIREIPALANGGIDLAAAETLIGEFKPHLVSVMTANNETGVIFPIPELTALAKAQGATFHTDAVQAFGKVPRADWLMADLISLSAHKIGGPKGIGALLVRNGKLAATHYGGAQEIKRRGGTENVLGILGFAGAIEDLAETKNVATLRDSFEKILTDRLPGISVQGQCLNRVPNTSNIRFNGIASEVLLSALDLDGICISAGSACSSGSIEPSHVLLAMGMTETEAKECVRFSFGAITTQTDIETIAERVIAHIERIRKRRGGLL